MRSEVPVRSNSRQIVESKQGLSKVVGDLVLDSQVYLLTLTFLEESTQCQEIWIFLWCFNLFIELVGVQVIK